MKQNSWRGSEGGRGVREGGEGGGEGAWVGAVEMHGLVDPKITTAFKVHMYIQISCTPSSLHTLIHSHPHIPSPHPPIPYLTPSHPYPLTSSHPHILTPHTIITSSLTSSSPHTLTLWVVGDWQGQHDSLGEKCRVTLITRV